MRIHKPQSVRSRPTRARGIALKPSIRGGELEPELPSRPQFVGGLKMSEDEQCEEEIPCKDCDKWVFCSIYNSVFIAKKEDQKKVG